MGRANKNLFIGGLLAIIVIMGVGYAAFQTKLTINGSAEITSTWDIKIQSIKAQASTTGAEDVEAETKVDQEDPLKATFSTKLVSPGDTLTYDVTVVNNGTIDAQVSGITVNQKNTGTGAAEAGDTVATTSDTGAGTYTTDASASNPITFSVNGIKEGDEITSDGGTNKFTITVTYSDLVTEQPTEAQLKSTLEILLSYKQKD